jgi:glycosyltransferase involved in cell wall biosynthesis
MKILFDGRSLADTKSGGVKRVASGLLQALRETDLEISVATTGTHRPKETNLHLSCPNKLVSIAIWLKRTSFDRLFRHDSDLLFLPNIGWLGKPSIPYGLVVHDLSFLIEPKWFNWKSRLWHQLIDAKRQIKNAQILFAVSEHTKNDLVQILGIPPERITVIPMGLEHAFTNETDQPREKYLLSMGLGDPRKNTELAKQVAQASGYTLKIIGDPLLGRIDDTELDRLYAHATAFLYPSWYEGFGLPLHEAARHGTPCIASTAGALPETAPHGTVFASPAKPQQWIQAINDILKIPEQHQTKTNMQNWKPAAAIIRSQLLLLNPQRRI